jgi:hypothetical protein
MNFHDKFSLNLAARSYARRPGFLQRRSYGASDTYTPRRDPTYLWFVSATVMDSGGSWWPDSGTCGGDAGGGDGGDGGGSE